MKQVTPEQLDLALNQLRKQNQTLQTVVADFDVEVQTEMSELLAIAVKGLSLQDNLSVINPKKRRLYINAPAPISTTAKWLKLLTAPAFGMAVFLLFAGTVAQAASSSLPGDSLYPLKRASERLRVAITTNPSSKAELELTYTKKRLAEAEKILQSEDRTAAQEIAAITELKEQSQKAFAAVPEIAADKIKNNNDDTLVKDLIAINNQQKALFDKTPEGAESKTEAHNALALAEQHEKTIAKILATVNNQSLANLEQKNVLSGVIEKIDQGEKKIIIEKQEVYFNDQTSFTLSEKAASSNILSTKYSAKITAIDQNGKLLAEKIELTSKVEPSLSSTEKKPEVKGTSVVNPDTKPNKPSDPLPQPEEKQTQPEKDPNQASAGFIPESNSEQYKP